MLWDRAKNLIIILFLALNMLLAFFVNRENSRYTLSQEQELAISAVLSQNKISLYSRIMRQFAPMRELTVSGYTYDLDELVGLFFEEPDRVAYVPYANKDIFEYGDERLVISNGYVSYSRNTGFTNDVAVDKDAAAILCGEFIETNYPDYVLDTTIMTEYGLRLCYRQVYQEYIVYGNFIEFLVTSEGIEQIDMRYGAVQGFLRDTRIIYAPDEALLTFIQRIRSLYANKPILITHMDIVYYQEEFSTQENISLIAVPYYRIFVEYNDVPFMINAYTNTCVN